MLKVKKRNLKELKLLLFSYESVSQIASKILLHSVLSTDHLQHEFVIKQLALFAQQILANQKHIT